MFHSSVFFSDACWGGGYRVYSLAHLPLYLYQSSSLLFFRNGAGCSVALCRKHFDFWRRGADIAGAWMGKWEAAWVTPVCSRVSCFFYRLTLSFFFLFLRRGYSMRRNACDARSLGPVVAFFRFEGEIESNERKETTLEYWEYWERWKYQKKKYTEVRNENFTYIASVKGWGRISTFDYLMRRQMLTWIPRWLVAREELLYATLPLYRSLNMVILWAHSAPDTISYNLCIYMHILVVCAYSVWAGQSSPMAWLFTEIQGFLETTEILFPKWSFAFPWEANRCAMHTGGRRHVVVTWRE